MAYYRLILSGDHVEVLGIDRHQLIGAERDAAFIHLAHQFPTWVLRDILNTRGLIVVEPSILDRD